ncbi:g7272 [Coccomyxa elongata]
MLQGWTLLGDQCPRCFTILVRNRERELFCVSCDMFLREEPPAEREDSPPSSSAHPQTLETNQQPTEAAGMQPPQIGGRTAAQPGIMDKQRDVAQVLRERLLDKMLDISKDLATASNAADCEQHLALLRSCCSTYHTVQAELV